MRLRQIRLGKTNWSGEIHRHRHALVRVSSGARPIPQPLADGISALRPDGMTLGLVDPSGPIPPSFWDQSFRSRTGPLRRRGRPADGYYLFRDGLVIAHHAGGVHAQTAAILRYLRGQLGEPEVSGDSEGWVYEEYVSSGPSRGVTSPPPGSADPYTTLGVAPDCSDDELRKAYKEAIKANHPDRVSHLSPALQQFALGQTLAIREAWETLKARRGL